MASMNSAPAPETLVMETSELVPAQEEEAARGRGDTVPLGPGPGRLLGHSNSSDNIIGSLRHTCHNNNNNTSQVGATAS